MSLHIIVDGYNLIHASVYLYPLAHRDLEEGREELIRLLVEYRRRRSHPVTVVFDGRIRGTLTGSRYRQGGVEVVFSPRGVEADETIKRMAAREGEGAVVVSSDREIAVAAERHGATVISSPEFERTLLGPEYGSEEDGGRDREFPSPVSSKRLTRKKGPSRRLPRNRRRARARLRKL